MRPCGEIFRISERTSNIMRRKQKWCVAGVILILFVIAILTKFTHVERSIDDPIFPGRDTYYNWAGGRYEILRPNDTEYYSLYRWQSREGESVPTCLSDYVIRFYVTDEYSYIEAVEGFMVIDHSTHAFPSFSDFSDLELRHQSVFLDSSMFQSILPQ